MKLVGPVLRLHSLWLALGYTLVALVVYLSLTSAPVKLEFSIPYEDKLFHALAYFSLMFWFAQLYHDTFQRRVLALIFILLGFLMEILQSMDAIRTAEFADMAANVAGVMLGYFVTRSAARFTLGKIESVFYRNS